MANVLVDKRLIAVSILVVTVIAILGLYVYKVDNPKNQLEINSPTDKTDVDEITNRDNSMDSQIEFQTISKGYYCGHSPPAYYVIRNEDEWVDVWNQYQSIFIPQRPPPEVNFSHTTIVAVFMGEFTTGGHGIEIKEILSVNQSVVVKVEKRYSGKGCGLTMAFSQPYHIVKIEKIDKEITFDTIERTN